MTELSDYFLLILKYTKNIKHCKILDITKLLEAPIIPKIGVNTKIKPMKDTAKFIRLIKTILAFS